MYAMLSYNSLFKIKLMINFLSPVCDIFFSLLFLHLICRFYIGMTQLYSLY